MHQSKKPCILIPAGIPLDGVSCIDEYEIIYPGEMNKLDEASIFKVLPKIDGVVATGAWPKRYTDAACNLKIIANYGSGYDAVDVEAATARGIPVTNIPDATAASTAQVAIGLILAVTHRISEMDARIRREDTSALFGAGLHMGMGLEGGVMGIVGMGRIGGLVAKFGRLMGMKVIYHNRRPVPGLEEDWRPLNELLSEADVVSIHCPFTEETRGLIDASRLQMMKPRSVIVNTARGGVIDMDALGDALIGKRIFGAGLDVYPAEPAVPERLKQLSNVVLTPHIGTNTVEARRVMLEACFQRIHHVLSGERPQNVVNPEIYLTK